MRLHEPVIAAARRTPHAPAVDAPDGRLDYGELDALAGRYSAALARAGVRAGDRVVLWSPKSLHVVALMQACLRGGVLYVPVSTTNPPVRLARIAAACTAALVVTDREGAEALAESAAQGPAQEPARSAARSSTESTARRSAANSAESTGAAPEKGGAAPQPPAPAPQYTTFDRLLAEAAGQPAPPPVDGSADDAAYILFTSGSTGEPKGVCLSHRNALSFVRWAVEELDLGPGDRLANHAPFNFDLSVFDLYAAFVAGASVHLVPEQLAYAPPQLARFIEEHAITVWYSVPSALTLMITRGGLLDGAPPRALRSCVFAGEPFPIAQVRRLRAAWPDVRLFNWYGPTETNVCTSYEVTDADLADRSALPIGTACSGDTLELGPRSPDRSGRELLVSGPTVMLGYWGHPPQSWPYATGDLVRYDAAGRLEYLGRRDHMVKVRGNRVELGEIEATLSLHPMVRDVAVVVVGSGLAAQLHAVAVAAPRSAPGLLDLKAWSAERLPTYMLIDALTLVDDIPRTDNGKKNRRLLAEILQGGAS